MLGKFLTKDQVAQLAREASSNGKEPWIKFDPEVMRTSYNRRSFSVPHRLTEHPLFKLDALFTLCRRLGEKSARVRFGEVPVDTDFDSSLSRFKKELTLEDAINSLEEKKAYIALYNPEQDPEYRAAIEGFFGEIAAQLRDVDPDLNWYSTYIFISAQGSVTPYHMDREMNFLLQIRGKKTVKLWDPFDDEIMTPAQKDALLARKGKRPEYRPSFEAKASTYELTPGFGVHHPFIAPHLVTTGPEVSISLALTFRTRQSDTWTAAHVFNHLARRVGLTPTPVASNPRFDRAKAALVRPALALKQNLNRMRGK
jgi:hypothetical protein